MYGAISIPPHILPNYLKFGFAAYMGEIPPPYRARQRLLYLYRLYADTHIVDEPFAVFIKF